MIRINLPILLGIIFIAFLVGSAYQSVGQPIICVEGEVIEWWFPLAVFGLIGVPFLLGYLGGSEL